MSIAQIDVLRGVITKSDVGSVGANLLSKEQFMAFYELATLQHRWQELHNSEPRTSHEGGVPRIDFTGDVIEGASEALDTGNYFEPSHSHVGYVQKKMRSSFVVARELIDPNGQTADPQYEERLINGFTRAWGRSYQKLAWMGDESDPDNMLKINDGWLVQMESGGNVVDGSTTNSGNLSVEHFYDALFALPKAWQQRQSELRFGLNPTKILQLRQYLSERATDLGDMMVTDGPDGLRIGGVPIVDVPDLPDTKMVLTSPQNTTDVPNPGNFSFRRVDEGLQAVAQDITAWVGFFYTDFILLEVTGTVVTQSLTA